MFISKLLVIASFLLFIGCTDKENSHEEAWNDIKIHYIKYFFIPDEAILSRENRNLSYYLKNTNDNLYNHHYVNNAPLLADRFFNEGYFKKGHENLSLKTPIPWGTIYKNDPNYTYGLNAMYPTEQFVFAYRKTNDLHYFHVVKDLHKDWITRNITENIDNPYKWYDMSTGLRTIQLAWLTKELIIQKHDPSEIIFFLDALEQHIEHLANPAEIGQGNHVIFQMAGIYATCNLMPNFKPCRKALPYAESEFTKELQNQFKSDGMHVEHSPSYHIFVASKIYSLLQTDWYSESIQEYVEKANENIIWLYRPELQLALLGDSEQMPPELYRYLSGTLDFLLSDGSEGITPPNSPALFPKTGYGILRSDWQLKPFSEHSYLFFNGANHSNVHNHPDFLSILWSDRGSPILVDAGKYSLDNSDLRKYVKSTRAHNTVQVDRLNMSAAETLPKGSAIESIHHDHFLRTGFISGKIFRGRTSTTHSRHTVLREGKWLLVSDILSTDKVRNFIQWFHFHPSLVKVATTQHTTTYRISENHSYLHVYDLLSNSVLSTFRGSTKPMTGWYSNSLFEAEPSEALALEKNGTEARYHTLLLISDQLDPPSFSEVGLSVQITKNQIKLCDNEAPKICATVKDSGVNLSTSQR